MHIPRRLLVVWMCIANVYLIWRILTYNVQPSRPLAVRPTCTPYHFIDTHIAVVTTERATERRNRLKISTGPNIFMSLTFHVAVPYEQDVFGHQVAAQPDMYNSGKWTIVSCLLTHLRAMSSEVIAAHLHARPYVIIVEDDISFTYLPAWPDYLSALMTRLTAQFPAWEYANLAPTRDKQTFVSTFPFSDNIDGRWSDLKAEPIVYRRRALFKHHISVWHNVSWMSWLKYRMASEPSVVGASMYAMRITPRVVRIATTLHGLVDPSSNTSLDSARSELCRILCRLGRCVPCDTLFIEPSDWMLPKMFNAIALAIPIAYPVNTATDGGIHHPVDSTGYTVRWSDYVRRGSTRATPC